jgi:hypothetical protein
MKPERQKAESFFGPDFRMFAQLPFKSSGVEPLKEQALQASGQELVDLYQMLRYKCKPAAPRQS